MGGSGSNSQSGEFKPPDYTQQGWKDYEGAAQQVASTPYQQFQGMRIAPMNDAQNTAAQFGLDRAFNGAPDLNTARGMVTDTEAGGFLGQGPGAQSHVTPGTNPLLGQNPYLNGVIGSTSDDMVNANRMGAQASLDSMAALGGGWGGSAWQQATAANQGALAKSIGSVTGGLRMQDYQKNQDLQEAGINRDLSAQQFNTTTQQGAFNDERGRQMTGAGLAGQLSQDDWTAMKAAMGIGDAYQASTQKSLDGAVDEFNRQQAWPQQMLALYGDALSRASGQGGQTSMMSNIPGMSGIGAAGGTLAGLAAFL